MKKETSYLGAMLTSQTNVHAVLATGALAVLASFPFGLVGAALPLLALAVGEVLASLVVPDLPSFRARVDQAARQSHRDEVRSTLLGVLAQRIPVTVGEFGLHHDRIRPLEPADAQRVTAFNRMLEQIETLANVAKDRDSSLGPPEIERLHEATLDFLSLWIARLIIEEREGSSDMDDIRDRLAQIEQSLPDADRSTSNQLRRAQAEYQGVLDRRNALIGKTVAIDAALTAMPDKVEEIYQMVVAAPYSKGIGDRLEDSLSRLQLADELEQDLSLGLSDTLPSGVPAIALGHAGSGPAPSLTAVNQRARSASQTTIH